jgi:hypothetical protein
MIVEFSFPVLALCLASKFSIVWYFPQIGFEVVLDKKHECGKVEPALVSYSWFRLDMPVLTLDPFIETRELVLTS